MTAEVTYRPLTGARDQVALAAVWRRENTAPVLRAFLRTVDCAPDT